MMRASGLSRRHFLVAASASVGGLMIPNRAAGALGAASVGGLLTPNRAPGALGAGRFSGAGAVEATVARAWFDLALDLVRTTAGYSPPVASRAVAYAGLTLYEAVVPGMGGFRSLAGLLPDLAETPVAGRSAAYDWELVANAGLAAILRELFATGTAASRASVDALETTFAARLGAGLPPGMVDRSITRGRTVAAALWDWAKRDGGHDGHLRNFPPYDPPTGPGFWVPTPPGLLPALQPFWGANRCFVLRDGAACATGDHPSYSEDPASAFYQEALEVFEAGTDLTPERLAIARFWSDDPGRTATPPGHSIAIATAVLEREGASLATAAEAYATVGMAISDAFVACWHGKYTANLLRPVTYLQRLIDPDWTPTLVTPPFPEYPSGHSVQSAAAFQVLTAMFGDGYRFTDHTHDSLGLAPRTFTSFLHAADEAAISRLYGGIHFRSAIDNGITQGRCIGDQINALPLRTEPTSA